MGVICNRLAELTILIKVSAMRKVSVFVCLLIAAAIFAGTGCKTKSGSREFIPGKGWVPN
jgi:hypothetical protein